MLVACGGIKPPSWDYCHSQRPANQEQSPPGTTDHLVVYLDTSASMAGYLSPNGSKAFSASPDGGTVFSKTLQELRDVVTTMSPGPKVVVRRVDTGVSPPSYGDLELSQSSINRGTFSGKDTDLAGAVNLFSQPLDKDAEPPLPPRFHILVTDGVQSTKQSNVDKSCAKGSDPTCVRHQLTRLMESGWGGAILGMRSEFDGSIYSEIMPKTIAYSSGKNPSQFRPFFLYIFSPDRSALDKLVDQLRSRLAGLNKDVIPTEYALTSDYAGGSPELEFGVDDSIKRQLSVRVEKQKEGHPDPHAIVEAALDIGKKGAQKFSIRVKPQWTGHALASGNSDDLAGLLTWELVPVFPKEEMKGHRYPDLYLRGQTNSQGTAELTLETEWPKATGQPDFRMFRLIGKVNVEQPAPPWISSWTTELDTTAEMGNKTLHLKSSLGGLWKNSKLEASPVTEICIRVGEK